MRTGRVIVRVGIANIDSNDYRNVDAQVDTGADVTVIPKRLARELNLKIKSHETVMTGGGKIMVGVAEVRMKIRGKDAPTFVWVTDMDSDRILIGLVVLEMLGLRVNPRRQTLEKQQMQLFAHNQARHLASMPRSSSVNISSF